MTGDLPAAFGSLSAADAAQLDAASERCGVGVNWLMQIAGWQVARATHRFASAHNCSDIAVIAGSGNNGGDGLVAARHLRAWGYHVSVDALADASRWPLAHLTSGFDSLEIPLTVDASGESARRRLADGTPVVLDALLGTGVSSAPRATHASVIESINAHTRIVSVDLPSGLDATTGTPFSTAVRAQMTCTLAAVKSGVWSAAAREFVGELWVADIGIPVAAWSAINEIAPTEVRGGALLRVF